MELIYIYINMVRINKIMKVLFGVLTLVLLLGCPLGAPHYYNYKLQEKIDDNNELKLKIDLSSQHLSGNKIDIWNNINIINTSNHLVTLDSMFFKVSSKVFNYRMFNASQVIMNKDKSHKYIPIYKTENEKLISKYHKILIKPKDSIRIVVIYDMKEKIKEKEFIKLRRKDTIDLSIELNKNRFKYTFYPID